MLCLAQAEEDDGYDPQRGWAHWRGEPLSHRPHPDGDEGEVCSWELAGEDVWVTVSVSLFQCTTRTDLDPDNIIVYVLQNSNEEGVILDAHDS